MDASGRRTRSRPGPVQRDLHPRVLARPALTEPGRTTRRALRAAAPAAGGEVRHHHRCRPDRAGRRQAIQHARARGSGRPDRCPPQERGPRRRGQVVRRRRRCPRLPGRPVQGRHCDLLRVRAAGNMPPARHQRRSDHPGTLCQRRNRPADPRRQAPLLPTTGCGEPRMVCRVRSVHTRPGRAHQTRGGLLRGPHRADRGPDESGRERRTHDPLPVPPAADADHARRPLPAGRAADDLLSLAPPHPHASSLPSAPVR